MKIQFHTLPILAAIFLSSWLLSGCSDSQAESHNQNMQDSGTAASIEKPNTNASLPQLLDRKEGLGTEAERNDILNRYGNAVKAIEKNASDFSSYLQLAEIFINEARVTGEHPHYYPAALQVLETVISKKPENRDVAFRALYMKALVQLSLHQFREGLASGQQALQINPYNSGIYGVLVDANVELGNYTEAVNMSDKMVAIRPDLRSYSRISYLRELHGEVDGAIEAMKMAVEAGYPGYEQTAWCRTTLGNLYETYGQLDQAEMQYQMVLQERPKYAFALAGLASVEKKKGNKKKALALLADACEVIPEVGFYIQKAEIMAEKGSGPELEKLTDEILAMMQEDSDAGHNMNLEVARVWLELKGNPAKALSYAQKEYEKRPENMEVNQLLAEIYAAQANWEQAASYANVAGKTNSKDPGLTCLTGVIKFKTGAEQEGKALVKQALEANPYLNGELAAYGKTIL